jgi:hypothetical protein
MAIQETLDRQGIIHSDPDIMSGTPSSSAPASPSKPSLTILKAHLDSLNFWQIFPT